MKTFLKMAIIFVSTFSASAAGTTIITRQIDVATYANNVQTEEDSRSPDVKELSDNERFINSLTTMGNLSADLNASISFKDITLLINGSINVNMEDIDNLSLSGDLSFNFDNRHIDLGFAYIDSYVYLDVFNNHIKFSTDDILDVVEVIKGFDIPLSIPEEIKNIKSDTLLANLATMKVVKHSNYLTYEFTLFEGLNPIIFYSDLNYQLTEILVSNLTMSDISISMDANVDVLGKGKSVVNNLEDRDNYIDGSSYFGLASTIQDIFDSKKISTDYNIEIVNQERNIFTSSGEIDFDFITNTFSAEGNILVDNKSSSYGLYYADENIYLNYDNSLKVNYSKQGINDLIEIINQYSNKAPLSLLTDTLGDISLPIVEQIKNKDYFGLLDYFDGVTFSNNEISLRLSNEAFNSGDTLINISLSKQENAFDTISISNLNLEGFIFNITLNIKEATPIELPSFDNYETLDGFNNIFEEVMVLCQNNEFAVGLNGTINLGSGNISFSGDTQFNLQEKNGMGTIQIIDGKGNKHNVAIDVYENNEMYFVYNNALKGYFNLNTVRELIDLVKQFINSDDPRFSQYSSLIEESLLSETIKKVKEGRYEALIVSGLIEDINFIGEDLKITIPSALVGGDNPLYLYIDMNNGSLHSVNISGGFSEISLNITLTLKTYNYSWKKIDISNKNTFTDFSEIKTLAECVLKTAELDYFDISGTLDLTAISLFNWNLPLKSQIKIESDERVRAYIEISDIPSLSHLISGKSRTSKIYIDGNDDVYIWTRGPGNSIFSGMSTTELKVTSEEFKKNILYYMCNVILGLSESLTSSFDTSKDHTIDYAKILRSYKYSASGQSTWNIVLDMQELTGSSAMNNLSATIKANNNKYMSSVNASMKIGSSIFSLNIVLNASLINIGKTFDFSYLYQYMNANKHRAYSYH